MWNYLKLFNNYLIRCDVVIMVNWFILPHQYLWGAWLALHEGALSVEMSRENEGNNMLCLALHCYKRSHSFQSFVNHKLSITSVCNFREFGRKLSLFQLSSSSKFSIASSKKKNRYVL